MTTIAAIFNRDGQPVEPSILDAMLAACPSRGRDGQDTWTEGGNVVLAHQHFRVAPEELGERQPLADPVTGRYVITCDARLDNRQALAQMLAAEAWGDGESSDATLILQAYVRWGAACVDRLLGAFAFAIWDRETQSLFVARDPLGERGVLYYLDGARCVVATEIGQILAHPAVRPRLNEGKIAEHLEVTATYEEETCYRDIFPCPPAHCLSITRDSFRAWRYWDIDPAAAIRYRRHEAYVEHFRALLTDAVRCRMRVAGPVAIAMSGGLDSLSIGALAASLMQETGHGGDRLRSFSYVFDELNSCDERAYIRPVADQCGIDATYVVGDDLWTLRDVARWPSYRSMPAQDPFVWLTIALLEQAQAQGCRVMLSGLFGDEIFSGAHYWAADAIRELRFGEVLPGLVRNRHTLDWRQEVVENGLRQLIPARLRTAYRRRRPRPPERFHPGLHPALIPRSGILERNARHLHDDRFAAPAQWHRYRALMHGSMGESEVALRELYSPYGIECADPFMDRRLVEFAMAVPADHLGLALPDQAHPRAMPWQTFCPKRPGSAWARPPWPR